MPFELTRAAIREWLEDDTSLETLRNQYTVDEVYELLEDKEKILTDDQLYGALLDVMYATRPKGLL